MLVTFKTDAYADITMFGDVALKMLKMMGHSGTVPSAILAEDIPAALERLKAAIDKDADAQTEQNNDDGDEPVSMHNRALPLISLLTVAAEAGSDVMWE